MWNVPAGLGEMADIINNILTQYTVITILQMYCIHISIIYKTVKLIFNPMNCVGRLCTISVQIPHMWKWYMRPFRQYWPQGLLSLDDKTLWMWHHTETMARNLLHFYFYLSDHRTDQGRHELWDGADGEISASLIAKFITHTHVPLALQDVILWCFSTLAFINHLPSCSCHSGRFRRAFTIKQNWYCSISTI